MVCTMRTLDSTGQPDMMELEWEEFVVVKNVKVDLVDFP